MQQSNNSQRQQRIAQAQSLQQQRLYANAQKVSLSTMDPSLLTLGYNHPGIKDEFQMVTDPTDPFALSNDYDLMNSNGQQHPNLLSPLSTSPLDPQDSYGDGPEELTPAGSGSLSGSPFGTPGVHQGFYSMSVPVRSGFPQAPNSLLASHPSSYHSFNGGVPTMSVLRGEEESLKQLDMLNEKRRKRRESHNAVERRRRDHINEKIQELSALLPEFAGDAQNKPNKGTILKRSVDYLKHIHAFAARQMERTRELENVLARLCAQQGIDTNSLGLSVPLGTPIEVPVMAMSNEGMDAEEAEE